MNAIKEIKGLKCPNHDYVRDNCNFTYEPAYPGARPLNSTRCIRCGYTMSLHKVQKKKKLQRTSKNLWDKNNYSFIIIEDYGTYIITNILASWSVSFAGRPIYCARTK